MKPVSHDGSATGGPETPLTKSMDKPAKKYTANENVPHDDFHEEAHPDVTKMDNRGSTGDRSKTFSDHF